MEFRVLQYFLAVAREQSISGAAESLHLTQPTLSTQLKALEAELGVRLFTRDRRTVELTEAGRVLCAEGEKLLRAAESAADAVRVAGTTEEPM